MYAPTAKGTLSGFAREPAMTPIRPNVATHSLSACGRPERTCMEAETTGSANIAWAATTPSAAPTSCAAT